jgi:hypothetical protein
MAEAPGPWAADGEGLALRVRLAAGQTARVRTLAIAGEPGALADRLAALISAR